MTHFEICYQFLCDFLYNSLQNFQPEKLKISRKWNYHFTYISQKKIKIPVIPVEIEIIEQQGIYVNICFSLAYLQSFLVDEILFDIPIDIEEDILFSRPLKMACYFRQCVQFHRTPWKDKDRIAILWRCYVIEAQKEADAKAIHFFCRNIEQMEKSQLYERHDDDLAMKYIANRLFEQHKMSIDK